MTDTECPCCNDAGLRIQNFDAAVFDLDGVVTQTARVHAASWKQLFDEYLGRRADETGEPFQPFDIDKDYRRYVDGKPRYDGVTSFLESRGIALLRGDPSDPPDRETVCGLGNRKNRYFRDSLKQDGVEVFESTVALIRRLRDRDVKTALVSSSRNARAVLEAAGLADLVVSDLATLHIRTRPAAPCQSVHAVPRILGRPGEIGRLLDGNRAAVFLDYDGTLTPIAARPDEAILSEGTRAAVKALARRCMVGIISGCDRADVERLVGLDELVYAGSHGFDISAPRGLKVEHQEGAAFAAVVRDAADRLGKVLAGVEGALVEPKRFAVAVHYRQVAEDEVPTVEDAVDRVLAEFADLRKTFGKKVFELRPRFDWDKGKAVLWVLEALGLDESDVVPFYVGDDTTDEDAFAVLTQRGVGVLVGCPARETAARYVLDRPADVRRFLEDLTTVLKERSHV